MAPPKVRAAAGQRRRRVSGPAEPPPPSHVAILGLGPSLESYVNYVKRLGARHAYADEVWAINGAADVIQCDRVFHMDDVRVQEIRAAAAPASNIAAMLGWLKTHPGPIYTSRKVAGYPGLVEFPLQDLINKLGFAYLNSTAAYAVAFAILIGVKKVSLFGMDFTYPNAHDAERGRACVEFWMGIGAARGVKFSLPAATSLLDTCDAAGEPGILRPYGYDAVDIRVKGRGAGDRRLVFTERPNLPTAEEIEDRYDHSKHPSPLMSGEANRKG